MSSLDRTDVRPNRTRAALALVRRRYWQRVRARPWLSAAALLLPGLGTVFVAYVPPLVIANILGMLVRNPRRAGSDFVLPVGVLVVSWLFGELLWRLAAWTISRAEVRAMESLYIEAMDELFAKDAAFFHDNF